MRIDSDSDAQERIDVQYMQHALELAKKGKGTTTPNPMVGAVIVKNGKIIAEGYHIRAGEGHAEVNAFNHAVEDVSGATMYVTLEPCSHFGKTPPCADKIIEKGIRRVVVGALDPNPLVAGNGVKKLQAAGIEVVTGVLAEESIKLNEVFMKYIVTHKPFVVFKTAMSLDGKIATSRGESQWISCEASRADVQRLRHELTGIMVGIGTVLADDPMLICRIPGSKQPVRIVVDSHLSIPIDTNLVKTAKTYPLIVATVSGSNPEKKKQLEKLGVQILESYADARGHVSLKDVMEQLGQLGVDSILLEGGGKLAESAFKAKVIDKVIMYIAPIFIGGVNAKTPIEGEGIARLSEAWKLTDIQVEKIETDLKVTAYVEEGR